MNARSIASRGLVGLLAALCVPACSSQSARASELPWWVDSIEVSPPGFGGIGAVTLSGTWIDTGAPDAIGHSILDGALHLTVSAPDLNVPTGDALTPWTLTEEFGPLPTLPSGEPINEITGSIFSVDPNNRGIRQKVSGPDFLGYLIPPPRGEFGGLGTLNSDLYQSRAFDVSADGRVVTGRNELRPNAAAFITSEAFAWSPSTGMISLGLLPGGSPGGSTGRGVSSDGNYIVGDSSIRRGPIQSQEAFQWSLGGGMNGLGTINEISSSSEARATSRNGLVTVGVDEFFPPTAGPLPGPTIRRAFRYQERTGMQDLGTLPQYSERSTTEATDVSAAGTVIVGTAFRDLSVLDDPFFPIDLAQPFRWTQNEGMVGLGNLPRFFPAIFPSPQQETLANAVSADGRTVVGVDRVIPPPFVDSQFPYFGESAVLWTRDGGWVDLGGFQLPPGPEFVGAEAVDVSGDGGLVVGMARVFATDATTEPIDPLTLEGEVDGFGRLNVPFIWDERRGMRPLARVLAGDFGLDFEGWTLSQVAAISDDGTTVVGTGINPNGDQEAWRAVMLRNTRPGDADFDGDVDRFDRAMLAEHLGMTAGEDELYYEDGDFDGDGAVTDDDLDLLLANYDGRALGDFNADGLIDAADYTLWRDHEGADSGIADSDGDGLTTGDDLAAWRANYGRTVAELSVAVPEPTSVAIALLAGTLLSLGRRGDR